MTTRNVASVADPHRSAGWRPILYLLRNPMWLADPPGRLERRRPGLVTVDPLVSILLSMWLSGEHFVPAALTVAVAVLAFAVMCAGVVLLTQTAPATMEPPAGN